MKLENRVEVGQWNWSWKVAVEVGNKHWNCKATMKVRKINRSWDVQSKLEKWCESIPDYFWFWTFQANFSSPTLARTFQLRRNYPTSEETFQLRSVLSNKEKCSNIRLSNFSFLPTALSTTCIPKSDYIISMGWTGLILLHEWRRRKIDWNKLLVWFASTLELVLLRNNPTLKFGIIRLSG